MESELGKGTSFQITIPAQVSKDLIDPMSARTTRKIKQRKARKPISILLAEDNPLNQIYSLNILEKAGHRVTVVENGADAVSAFKAEPFDLVLMDIQMPIVDGEQATQEIREIDKDEKVPIVALTANVMREAKNRYLEIGMNSVLIKPFTQEDLLDLVDNLMVKPIQQELTGK